MNTSTALPRLAVGAAATGLAATAQAQFTGMFEITPPASGTYNFFTETTTAFGNWTFSTVAGTASNFFNQVSTNASTLTLSATSISFPETEWTYDDITLPIASAGTVSFDYSFPSFASGDAFAGYTTDGSTWTPFSSISGSSFTVPVAPGDVFGFRLGDNYVGTPGSSLTISNISFAAVPEAGSFGLVAGVASLGYVGLVATRRRRARAALAA
jgi:hypothetical protein